MRDRRREREPAKERNVKFLITTEMRKRERGVREEMHALPLMRSKMKEERDEERLKDKTQCNWKVGLKSENGREIRKT